VSAETAGNSGVSADKRGGKSYKTVILAGIFFGLGFAAGFLAGFNFDRGEAQLPLGAFAEDNSVSSDASAAVPLPLARQDDEAAEMDSDLVLEDDELGEDENGLFISGTIYNRSSHGYDAVRATFDLCDAGGLAYGGVTDVTYDRMAPGDSWGFTIYIPYSEMDKFSSYRLHSIMGTTR
jgi:hypothetical protein